MRSELFLPDTSIWIPVLRKNPVESLKERIKHLLQENVVAVMPIISVELLGGAKNEMDFERLKKRLDSLILFTMNTEVWNDASRLGFDLRRNGITVPYTDIIIAATAIHYNATLIHIDRHFNMIASKSLLKVESHTK